LTAALLIAVTVPCLAHAELNGQQLGNIEAAPEPSAPLPGDLKLENEAGEIHPVQQWLGGKPTLWVLADYTCKTLCGPIVSVVADALRQTGLRPGADFRFIVIGLDPKDSAADARAMKDAQVGTRGDLPTATYFLRGGAEDVAALAAAFAWAAASAQAASPSDWMYEPTTFTEIRLELPPASFQLLKDIEYEEYVEGTFQIAETDGVPGQVGPLSAPLTVGVKLKGGIGSRRSIDQKAGLKIKFDEFVDGQTFDGLEKMTLNNMVQDPTMTHEVLAYQAFRQMGVFAPGAGLPYCFTLAR